MDLYNKLTSGLNATGQFFPVDLGPTRPTVEFGTALLAYPQTLRDRFMLGRVDHRISDRDQLSVRYGFDSQTSPTGGGTNFPGYFTSFAQRYNNSVITETHVFSPSLTNEFRLPYNRNVKVPDTGDVVNHARAYSSPSAYPVSANRNSNSVLAAWLASIS